MAEEQKQNPITEEPKAVSTKPKPEVKVEQKVESKKAAEAKPQTSTPTKSASFKHIVRIANVDIPGNKPIKIALRKIKGVGFNMAAAGCNLARVDKDKTAGELTDKEIKDLNEVISKPKDNGVPVWMFNRRKDYETGEDQHLLIGTLDFAKDNTIKRLRKIKCFRGTRHSRGLPCRGQRTKANFRKSKGKVVGVAKKKSAKSGK